MKNVIGIVKDQVGRRPVVVISAIARATNELEQMARSAATGNAAGAGETLRQLFGRHETIIDQLLECAGTREELRRVFQVHREELQRLIQGVSILKELTARTMDAFCAYGERLSSRLIAAGLREAGVESVWVDARDFMRTDDNFGRALPLMDDVAALLDQHVRPMLEQGKVPVTQGFIGMTRSGDYTTMGRESSDFSASIIGAAMGAEEVQIWTDVDGILTADPAVVSGVRKLKRMSFEEAFELSYFGAKVLHANTMLPVKEKGIPVQIRNSKKREGTGTTVGSTPASKVGGGLVKSIAFKSDVVVLTVAPRKRSGQYLFWDGVFSVLTRRGISAGLTGTSEYSIGLVVDAKNDVAGLRRELEEFGIVEVLEGRGSICLVGSELRGAQGLMERVFRALAGLPVTMVSYGASALNLTLIIERVHVHDAVRRLHREFFEQGATEDQFEPLPR
jgi:aspartate kinase